MDVGKNNKNNKRNDYGYGAMLTALHGINSVNPLNNTLR